jgi:hypothetical protein
VIARENVEAISSRRGSMKMQHRLTLHLEGGRTETFVVDDPEAWENALREATDPP